MKNQKWIKWIVGVTGALVFTGFVGYINTNRQTQTQNIAVQQERQQTNPSAPFARRNMDHDKDQFLSDRSYGSNASDSHSTGSTNSQTVPQQNDSIGSTNHQTAPQQSDQRVRTRAS